MAFSGIPARNCLPEAPSPSPCAGLSIIAGSPSDIPGAQRLSRISARIAGSLMAGGGAWPLYRRSSSGCPGIFHEGVRGSRFTMFCPPEGKDGPICWTSRFTPGVRTMNPTGGPVLVPHHGDAGFFSSLPDSCTGEDPGTSDMAAPEPVLLEVALVVLLCPPEGRCGGDLGRNRPVPELP